MKHFSRSMLTFATASVLLLSGCALFVPRATGPFSFDLAPTQPQSDLELSRQAFSRGNYGIAIRHLELVLAQSPASIAALNGLGASYDQLGRHDVALRYYFKALDLVPESTLTLNNIGYSYFLQGSREESARYLELALIHDANEDANQDAVRENLRRTLELQTPDEEPDLVVASAGAQLSPPALADSTQRNDIEALASFRIEVSNGNGVNGMAALVRAYLQQEGGNVVRLTNADNFAYASSTVYYRPGFRHAADALVARLPRNSVAVAESNALVDRVDVLLLIGKDLVTFNDNEQQGVILAQHYER
jgi:tetratricopeptide (TPR) repeat protein